MQPEQKRRVRNDHTKETCHGVLKDLACLKHGCSVEQGGCDLSKTSDESYSGRMCTDKVVKNFEAKQFAHASNSRCQTVSCQVVTEGVNKTPQLKRTPLSSLANINDQDGV